MLIKLLVKFYGGFWNLKSKSLNHKSNLYKSWLLWLYKQYMQLFSAEISNNVKFTGLPILPHGLHGIFISGSAEIGSDCIIYHQVTIGTNSLPDSKGVGAPVIGNNVLIGAGAKIIGNVRVGNNCRIGANAVITKNIPDNCTVISGFQIIKTHSSPPVNKLYQIRNDHWVIQNTDGNFYRVSDTTTINILNTAFSINLPVTD